MIPKEKLKKIKKIWIEASIKLKFKIVMPYNIKVNGIEQEVFGHLPEYGSKNGILICLISAPEFTTDPDIISWARENEFFYSFINYENFDTYDENIFTEMLDDWGKFPHSSSDKD